MLILLVTVVVSFLIWLLTLRWRRREFEALYKQMKMSAPRLPIIGHIYLLLCSDEERMTQIQVLGREIIHRGGIAGFWVIHKLYVAVADPEVAEILLKSCLEKDDVVKCFHLAVGDGSVFASVEKWRPRRKFLAPTFGMKNLNYYVKIFSKLSGLIGEEVKKEISAGKDSIRMEKVYLNYSMNAILESLGIALQVQSNTHHPFLLALQEVMSAAITRVFHPWLYSDFVYKLLPRYHRLMRHEPVIFGMVHKAIDEKKKEIEESHDTSSKDISSSIKLKTFISLMIESPADVSDNVIREECIVMISAASDTTTVSLGYVTLMLARYPEEQENIYNELKEVFDDFQRPITPEDLPRLKYLDAFIRETLRLYPPVPIIVRKTEQNIELPSGITLVPGCGIIIHIWAVNRNPKYWGEDAEQFRPARFLEPTQRHPAAFATFSHGPRNCLGYQYAMMSIKTVAATILSQYRVEAASEELKHEPLRLKYDLMMRHLDNYRVRFEPR